MRRDRGPGRASLVLAAAVALSIALAAQSARAHPLGNFSISHYSAISVGDGAVTVRYVVDLAEIPAFQEIQEAGIAADLGHPGLAAYLVEKAEALRAGLRLDQDGRPLRLETESRGVIFPPGAGGLPTMKLGVSYRAVLERAVAPGASSGLYFRDDNFAGRAGWKEIVAVGGAGVALAQSSVPERDKSHALSDYPTDLLNSPPQVTEARVVFIAAAPVPPAPAAESRQRSDSAVAARPPISMAEPSVSPGRPAPVNSRLETTAPPGPSAVGLPSDGAPALRANRQATPRSAFTELVAAKELGLGVVLLAVAIAAALGALHALEPGHGKTVVGAYLVGSRGTASHAVLLGLIVTASHTAGVYLLGAVTLFASRYVVPERIYPWLGVTSGLLIAGVGIFLLRQRYRGETAHAHDHHHHGHSHSHEHGEAHRHGHDDHGHHHHGDETPDRAPGAPPGHGHRHPDRAVPLRQLVALGVSGGIVPCPAALVVLLSALALHRVGFGLLLIVAFSAGLAAVLIAVGLLIVHARRFVARFDEGGGLFTRWLPVTSAAMITLLGVGMAIQALATAGVLPVGRS